jgi:diguanylate cyclase (GGDEF)-like protein
MTLEPLDALSRLAARRFGSFADASGSVLDLLAGALPAGCVLLCQLDWEAGEARVVDSRGDVERGATLALATQDAAGTDELIEPESLAGVWPGRFACAPLDAADGSVVGVLLASSGPGGPPPPYAGQLMVVAARLLSYEWESISTRAELRRLADAARDRDHTDSVTGLPTRATLLESLEREWELSSRGTVETQVVVYHLSERPELAARHGAALADLLLKEVAEVLAGAVRRTDHLARVGDDALAAVLVGCRGTEGALAFLMRVERALERVAAGRPAAGLSYGIHALAGSDSAARALELAEAAALSGQHVAPLDAAPTEEAA